MESVLRVHWFQHVPFEGLGSIGAWLEHKRAQVSSTAFWNGEAPPTTENFDGLIVMGGPMSVHDEAMYPWLREEKGAIRDAIARGKVVLGICLGAQLIAEVLGGQVTRNAEREIGWFPIERIPHAATHALGGVLPHQEPVFHWHGETFSIPAGTTLLSRSAACAHQAFAWEDRVLALQFHLETTAESAKAMVEHCAADLAPGPFVQSAAEITDSAARCTRINEAMARLLDSLPWHSSSR
jgi:GMP synthase-like glutamine amidotransferase